MADVTIQTGKTFYSLPRGGHITDTFANGDILVLLGMDASAGSPYYYEFYYSQDGGSTWAAATHNVSTTSRPVKNTSSTSQEQIQQLRIDNADNIHVITWNNSVGIEYHKGTWNAGTGEITWIAKHTLTGQATTVSQGFVAFTMPSGSSYAVFADCLGTTNVQTWTIKVDSGGTLTEIDNINQYPGTNNSLSALTKYRVAIGFKHTGDGKTPAASPDLCFAVQETSDDIHFWEVPWVSETNGYDFPTNSAMYETAGQVTDSFIHQSQLFYNASLGKWALVGHQGISTSYDPVVLVFSGGAAATAYTFDTGSVSTYPTYFAATYDANTDTIYIVYQNDNSTTQKMYVPFSLSSSPSFGTEQGPFTVTGINQEGACSCPPIGSWGAALLYMVYNNFGTTVQKWTDLDGLVFNTAPNAPIIDNPLDGVAQDVNASLAIDWTFNDPDNGDTQSAYTVRRKIGAAGSYNYWNGSTWQASEDASTKIATATSLLTLASSWGAGGDQDHYYSVKTWDSYDEEGPFASDVRVIPSVKVNPTITSPALDGDDVDSIHLVTWTVSEQTKYRVRVLGDIAGSPDTGSVFYDSGIITSGTTSNSTPFSPTGSVRHIELTTWNDEGLASDLVYRRVDVVYTTPPQPTITTVSSGGNVEVQITNPSGATPVTHNDLYRREVGETVGIRIATLLPSNLDFTDWTVASGKTYEYLVRAFGNNGTTIDSTWTT